MRTFSSICATLRISVSTIWVIEDVREENILSNVKIFQEDVVPKGRCGVSFLMVSGTLRDLTSILIRSVGNIAVPAVVHDGRRQLSRVWVV